MLELMREWCEAQKAYEEENFPGGFPKYKTAHRLYVAGRAVYAAAGVEPGSGRYERNKLMDNPPPRLQEWLND